MSKTVVYALALLGFAPSAAVAFGNDEAWTSGFGQGISEAIITKGPGNQIYVTCNSGGAIGGSTSISFMLGGNGAPGSTVTLTFDGEDPIEFSLQNGQISSDCRTCMQNYEYVIEKFRTKAWVHVLFEDGVGTRFTLNGANDAIVECVPDFA